MHAGEPRSRTEDQQVGGSDGVEGLRARARPVGRRRTRRTRPGVEATATWPRMRCGSRGPLAQPDDLGLDVERRRGSSAAPARAARAARRPRRAPRPGRRAAPSARRGAGCPRRARPGPRYRRSGAGRPRSSGAAASSSDRRARPSPSAGRRGAAGRSSRRRRPEDPPSSATVTTAVTSSVGSSRSADSVACRPCPPPSATARQPGVVRAPGRGAVIRAPGRGAVIRAQVAARHSRPSRSTSASRPGELLADRHAAVLAARAADRDRQVALALAPVARRRPA